MMMQKSFEIAGRKLGQGHKPYVIAELSGNHNGSFEAAKSIVKAAKKTGADAVKIQTYTADSLTLDTDDEDFLIKQGTWAGRRLHALYQEAQTPQAWLPELFSYAKEVGITLFSSPFDAKAVAQLEALECPAYKIASNEMTDWPLLKAVAQTKKPVILSTGIATRDDLKQTVQFLSELGVQNLAILHCISKYPALASDSNLNTMLEIAQDFDVPVGLSDHTLGTVTSVAAVALGACVIEKHFIEDRSAGGVDSSFSLEPEEFATLCEETEQAWQSLGQVTYGGDADLASHGVFTRQLWSIAPIKAGETLGWHNIRSTRAPSHRKGLSPMAFRQIIDQKARIDIAKHTPITQDMIAE